MEFSYFAEYTAYDNDTIQHLRSKKTEVVSARHKTIRLLNAYPVFGPFDPIEGEVGASYRGCPRHQLCEPKPPHYPLKASRCQFWLNDLYTETRPNTTHKIITFFTYRINLRLIYFPDYSNLKHLENKEVWTLDFTPLNYVVSSRHWN